MGHGVGFGVCAGVGVGVGVAVGVAWAWVWLLVWARASVSLVWASVASVVLQALVLLSPLMLMSVWCDSVAIGMVTSSRVLGVL